MRKLIFATLAIVIATPASAGTSRQELWRDRQHIREERMEWNHALRFGSPARIREERREYHAAVREYREDLRDWRWHNRRR